ncbi:MAG TPA: molybdate ABC transporter substrate-binding protein [Gaiellaceae bacterium]
MKRLATLGLLLLALVGVLAAGCGGSDDSSSSGSGASISSSEKTTVFAAASLTEVFQALDPSVTYNFAGSDDLAAQIEEGAPADVFASASTKYGDELFDKGLIEKPQIFATNKLVLIVPKDNPADIHSVADLNKDGVKLVVGAEGVPVGDYTRKVLENMGQTSVLDNVVSNEDDVKAVVAKVAQGEADAGFVYVTDVKPAGADVTSITLPEDAQATVEYPIAAVKGAKNAEGAKDFVDLVLSDTGRNALEDAGFGVP